MFPRAQRAGSWSRARHHTHPGAPFTAITRTPGSPEALARARDIVDRLTVRQLEYLEAAEARRAKYLEEKQGEWDELEHERSKPGLLKRIGSWLGGGGGDE